MKADKSSKKSQKSKKMEKVIGHSIDFLNALIRLDRNAPADQLKVITIDGRIDGAVFRELKDQLARYKPDAPEALTQYSSAGAFDVKLEFGDMLKVELPLNQEQKAGRRSSMNKSVQDRWTSELYEECIRLANAKVKKVKATAKGFHFGDLSPDQINHNIIFVHKKKKPGVRQQKSVEVEDKADRVNEEDEADSTSKKLVEKDATYLPMHIKHFGETPLEACGKRLALFDDRTLAEEVLVDKYVAFYFDHPNGFGDDDLPSYYTMTDLGPIKGVGKGTRQGMKRMDTILMDEYRSLQNHQKTAQHKLSLEFKHFPDIVDTLLGDELAKTEVLTFVRKFLLSMPLKDPKLKITASEIDAQKMTIRKGATQGIVVVRF